MKKWTTKELSFLRKHYFCADQNFLMNSLGRNWNTIQRKASYLELNRTRSGANVKLFDDWSQKMAYILGFIAADGCISENPLELSITLATKDIDHLKIIKNIVAPRNSIYLGEAIVKEKRYKYARFSAASNYMCGRLIELGIMPRKSLKLKFPHIPNKYLNHFIRGYFDGDGSIYKTKEKRWCLSFIGTHQFLDSTVRILENKIDVGPKTIYKSKHSNTYYISFGREDTIKIGKWLYLDSEIQLKRKQNKFNELLNEY